MCWDATLYGSKDAANVCKKRSAEQLHADGLTMGKVADILPWSAEVTAVTAHPSGEPTALCSQNG